MQRTMPGVRRRTSVSPAPQAGGQHIDTKCPATLLSSIRIRSKLTPLLLWGSGQPGGFQPVVLMCIYHSVVVNHSHQPPHGKDLLHRVSSGDVKMGLPHPTCKTEDHSFVLCICSFYFPWTE